MFDLAASGGKATKNVVVNLTSLLASAVEATGKCISMVHVAAEDFDGRWSTSPCR